jgi:hypothetical protein
VRLVIALLLLALTAAPAAAEKVTQVADAGSLHAELTFDQEGTDPPVYSNMVLRITDGGVLVRTDHVPDGFAPGNQAGQSVAAADFDRDGAPEVLLDIFSGGAHCCAESRIYDGARRFVREWRDAGRTVVERGGFTWFMSSDAFFAYAYGAYAFSRLPLQIVRYVDGGFRDVTRAVAWRTELTADRDQLVREYVKVRKRYRGTSSQQVLRATLAAAAADDCNLGNCKRGLVRIAIAAQRGEIVRYGRRGTSAGAAFLRDVKKHLRTGGYLR